MGKYSISTTNSKLGVSIIFQQIQDIFNKWSALAEQCHWMLVSKEISDGGFQATGAQGIDTKDQSGPNIALN